MSGFTIIKEGLVTIEHLSRASLIKLTVRHEGYDELSASSVAYTEHILEYDEFSDLKKAISRSDDWL